MMIDGYGDVGSYIEKDSVWWHRARNSDSELRSCVPVFRRTMSREHTDVLTMWCGVSSKWRHRTFKRRIGIESKSNGMHSVTRLFSHSDPSVLLTIDKCRRGREFFEQRWNLTTACCAYVNASSELDLFKNLRDNDRGHQKWDGWRCVAYQGWRRIFRILRHDLFRRPISDRSSSSLHRGTPKTQHHRIV